MKWGITGVFFIPIHVALAQTDQTVEIFCDQLSQHETYPEVFLHRGASLTLQWYDLSHFVVVREAIQKDIAALPTNEQAIIAHLKDHALDQLLAKAYYPHVKVQYRSIVPPALWLQQRTIPMSACEPEQVTSAIQQHWQQEW